MYGPGAPSQTSIASLSLREAEGADAVERGRPRLASRGVRTATSRRHHPGAAGTAAREVMAGAGCSAPPAARRPHDAARIRGQERGARVGSNVGRALIRARFGSIFGRPLALTFGVASVDDSPIRRHRAFGTVSGSSSRIVETNCGQGPGACAVGQIRQESSRARACVGLPGAAETA